MIKFCSQCGSGLKGNFCSDCGAAGLAQEAPPMAAVPIAAPVEHRPLQGAAVASTGTGTGAEQVPKAKSLVDTISILELGHRKALIDLDLITEAGAAVGLMAPSDSTEEKDMIKTLFGMHAALERFRKDLQARRALVGALEAEVASCNADRDPALAPYMAQLSAWLRGEVEGNMTPAAGALPLEMAHGPIKEATDPGRRTLLILAVRALKMRSGVERLLAVERGLLLRPADGSLGGPAMPPLRFTAEQRASATLAFADKLLPELRRLEEEVCAAAALCKGPAHEAIAAAGGLAEHMAALRAAVASRAALEK
jgi:hypothetical protein